MNIQAASAFASEHSDEEASWIEWYLRNRPQQPIGRRIICCAHCGTADFALIAPAIEVVEYPARHLLYNPGDHVGTVYFPCGPSLVSYLVTNEDGRDVETMLVGREGAVGGIVSRGNLPAYTRMIVQFGGPFAHLRLDLLEAAKSKSASLNGMFARYADCMLAQMVQAAACNATHAIEQRTAKWIVSAMERTGDAVVPLTQEQLAAMLGVGRSYASRVIQTFRREGFWKRGVARCW